MSDWLAEELPLPTPRPRAEHALHRSVVRFLRLALPDDAAFMHVPNHGRRGTLEAALLASLGQLPGAPDLLVVWRGRALFIELKTPVGALSKTQKLTHRRLIAAGADVCVCRSLEGVEASLREAGLRLRATCLGRAA